MNPLADRSAAATVAGMEILGNGIIVLANGLLAMGHGLASITTVCIVLSTLSLAWFARLETDELNRQGTKPQIGRH